MMACHAAQMTIGVLIAPIRVNSRIDQYPGMAWPPTVPPCTRYASAAFTKLRCSEHSIWHCLGRPRCGRLQQIPIALAHTPRR